MARPYKGHRTPNLPRPGGNGDSWKVLEDFGDILSSGLSDLPTTGEFNTLPSLPWEKGLNKYHPDAVQRAHSYYWLVCFCANFPGRATG